MNPLKWSWLPTGYDAARPSKRRKAEVTNLRREDDLLKDRDRDKVMSQTRSLRRNSSLAKWAINKHLDHVSTFTDQCRSGDVQLDRRVETFIRKWSRRDRCDVSGRFDFDRLIRLIEGLAVVDGDVFVSQISDGRLQIIEADRVRTPTDWGDTLEEIRKGNSINGVQVTDTGKPLRYAVCDREGAGYVLRSILPARYVYHHAYLDRYDQVRGVSPLASAINAILDVKECQQHALAKAKLSQIFGLKLKRAETEDDDVGADYNFSFDDGPQTLDLDSGDDAEFLESRNPSTEFQAFMQEVIGEALKSLDIPYGAWNESFTDYSGSRSALLQYEQGQQQTQGATDASRRAPGVGDRHRRHGRRAGSRRPQCRRAQPEAPSASVCRGSTRSKRRRRRSKLSLAVCGRGRRSR